MNSLKILLLSFLVPSEFNFSIGELILSPYRVVLLSLAPYLLFKLLTRAQHINWCTTDLVAFTVCMWPTISFGLNTGIGAAIESGGIQTLELIVPYFLVRLKVYSHEKRVELAKTLFFMTAVLFMLGLPESILGKHFTHEIAGAITGTPYSGQVEKRLGIWRAMGPTDHAIIFGTLCAVTLSLAYVRAQFQRTRWLNVGLSAGGAILSASSAPILAIVAQISMLVWAQLMRGNRYRWWLLLGVVLAIYITVDVVSNRDPIRVMFSYLLLNPTTGYARYYMWIYSFEVVGQSTWGLLFGYGYDLNIFQVLDNYYWQNLLENTVDSFWLVFMLRFGMIGLALFALLVILCLRHSLRYVFSSRKKQKRMFMQGWFIGTFAMTLIATTVHFWGFMTCIYMIFLAVCIGGNRSTVRQKSKSDVAISNRAHKAQKIQPGSISPLTREHL